MNFLLRTVPLHFYLVIAYTILIALSGFGSGADGFNFGATLFEIPLFGGQEGAEASGVKITWEALIVIFAFVAQWLEAIRATAVAGTSRNDVWSLILAVVSVVLFVGVPQFQTFAFFVIVIVAFGDVLLDRIIGQAVAQRDFGGMIPGGG